ncbi:MAG: winged helix-turn-helix domain-containing protein [Candidatus Hadarchaeales archaeon]
MGITEDIQWLKSDEGSLLTIFAIIAKSGPCSLRQIKMSYSKNGDWWPVKLYVKMLEEKKIVEEREGEYSLTEYGKKILETIKATEDLTAL